MQKSTLLFVIALLVSVTAIGQAVQADDAAKYFAEVKSATAKNKSLWNKDIYGPLLLVDKDQGLVYANFPDSMGVLSKQKSVYTTTTLGDLKPETGPQNWNGRRWAVVLLPLPRLEKDRTGLLARELFRASAPSLDLKLQQPNLAHLNEKDARVYLRLELEALKKALLATEPAEMRKHLTSAFVFRKHRYQLYPDAASPENMQEINEGLPHYTALSMSGRKEVEISPFLIMQLNSLLSSQRLEQDFANVTVPLYGFIFQKIKKDWTRDIKPETNLSTYFASGFGVSLPPDVKAIAKRNFTAHNGPAIEAEETKRAEELNMSAK